jgi:hypothetical protein
MTVAATEGARVMAEHPARQADLAIGSMTVRGRSLSPAVGQNLATAIAAVLARQLSVRSAHIDGMTIRLPASVLDASGGIDRAALAQAVARARRDPDA